MSDEPHLPPALLRPADEEAVGRDFGRWLKARAKAAGRAVAERGLVAWYTMRDPETPAVAKGILLGALAYLADPIDAIPDLTPLVGYTDDMTLLSVAFLLVAASIRPEHHEKARAKCDEIFGEVKPSAE